MSTRRKRLKSKWHVRLKNVFVGIGAKSRINYITDGNNQKHIVTQTYKKFIYGGDTKQHAQ